MQTIEGKDGMRWQLKLTPAVVDRVRSDSFDVLDLARPETVAADDSALMALWIAVDPDAKKVGLDNLRVFLAAMDEGQLARALIAFLRELAAFHKSIGNVRNWLSINRRADGYARHVRKIEKRQRAK